MMKFKKQRNVSVCASCILILSLVIALGSFIFAGDPFAPESSDAIIWHRSSARDWTVHMANRRMGVIGRSAHPLINEVFEPLQKGRSLSSAKFNALFQEHSSSAADQPERIAELHTILNERKAQIDVLCFAHDSQTNTVVTSLILLPRKNVNKGERAKSYPVAAVRQGDDAWVYFIPGAAIRKDMFAMLHAAQRNASDEDVYRFWKQIEQFDSEMPGSMVNASKHVRPPENYLQETRKTGPFSSFEEAALYQLEERKSDFASDDKLKMQRADAEHVLLCPKIDISMAREFDRALGDAYRARGKEPTLDSISFDALWSVYRPNITNMMLSLSLSGTKADDISQNSAVNTLRRYITGLKQSDHDAVLSTLEKGSGLHKRYRNFSRSPLAAAIQKQLSARYANMTIVFELPFAAGNQRYSYIYYRVDADEVEGQAGANRLDNVVLKAVSSDRWVITEEVVDGVLRRTTSQALPTARHKTINEVHTIISEHPSVSRVFEQTIKPRLLATE